MVWQTFIKETLEEAVKEDKLVWAYLFCWPRWTGKTSTARILAKTINCLNPNLWNPCHECEICKNFSENKLIDIIEIDAASHTWVDNIRDIIEKAQFLPNKAKYKVYIIDEVHMLSTWAFNALLKILEEPPSFVKFILATTESHKIPETILSRCQRYDFKNISEKDIKDRLEYIAREENVKVDWKAIDFIVKNSHWWLRNAITLFEQFIINNEIKYENIINNLWITENSFVSDFLTKLINKDISVVNDFDKITVDGKNIKLFFKDLIYFTRDEIIKNLDNLKKILELNSILEILDETYSKTKNAMDEKITLLSGILKVITKDENRIQNTEYSIQGKKTIPFWTKVEESTNQWNSTKQKNIDTEIGLGWHPITHNNTTINHDDILDVFWSNEAIESKKEDTKITEDIGFSKDTLVAKIKELWGKWWLTMWIRWWDVRFDWTTLFIKAPSKIALKSIEEAWSNDIILQAMENIWYKDAKLKIS